MTLFENMIEAVGHTPLVRLRMAPPQARVYAKLELANPFSMKDRVGRQIVLAARRDGRLTPGAPIIESSSGSMALGLAITGRALGHAVHIVTDPRIDPITLAKLHALGCTVHVVSEMNGGGWQGARLALVDELLHTLPGAFYPQQYTNPQNPAAYESLAQELLADLGSVAVLVGSVGSGGSLCGTARALRLAGQRVRVVGVDSVGSVLFGQPDTPGRLQSGLGNSLPVRNLDHAVVDEIHWLNDREAFTGTRDLAAEQQIFAGNTAGSVYRILRHVAASAPDGPVVGIFPDRGDRYAGTVYSDEYWAEKGLDRLTDSAEPTVVEYGTPVTGWSCVPLRPAGAPDRLVFVESNTTGTGVAAIGKATEMGLRPVLHTTDPARYRGLPAHTEVVVGETGDVDLLEKALTDGRTSEDVAGITTTSDYYLQAVAELTARRGLPGNDPEAVARCRDKSRTRAALAHAGVPQPEWAVVADESAVADAVRAVGLPCVVKPVDDSGSVNVLRCDDVATAAAQVRRILARRTNDRGQPMLRKALVERYVAGAEVSAETFSQDGATTLVGITRTEIGPAPRFVETGHTFPSDVPPEVGAVVGDVVAAALAAVGYTWGPAHTELRVTPDGRVVVLEVNARLAGGMIPELVRQAMGVDLVQQQLCLAVGRPVHLERRQSRHAGIRFLTAPSAGTLTAVTGIEEACRLPGVVEAVLTRPLGAAVRPAESGLDRLGYVIAAADRAEDVTSTLDTAVAGVELTITEGPTS